MAHGVQRILWFPAMLMIGCGGDPTVGDATDEEPSFSTTAPPLHVNGQKPAKGGGHHSNPLLFHGGNVLTSNRTHAIWWGPQWSSSSFAGDKVSGMESF